MSNALQQLVEQYTSLLQTYVGAPAEALRARAYQLACEAIASGLGVLDVAAAHREALLSVLVRTRTAQESEQMSRRASEVLLESLAPFEMTHRGYQETIRKLIAANEALRKAHDELEERVKERTAELAKANVELRAEIAERQRLLGKVEELAAVAQRRAAELQGMLDNMVDAVFVCDAAGRITLANKAGVRMSGLGSFAELRRPLQELADLIRPRHPDGRPMAAAELPLARALAGEIVAQEVGLFYNPSTQQDIYVRTSAAPIRDEQGNIVSAVAVSTDVTELTELDRLKDQFISVAAHELKTPVTIMKGYAQALLRMPEVVAPPRRRMLEAIDRGSDRIDRVVMDLLDISRLHAGRLELEVERIDLPAFVAEVVDRTALTTTKHRIRVPRAEPVVVHGDRNRLEQVLINLLDNALKYSPDGGDIDVSVAVSDHEAVVSVRDYGVGVPKEKQGRIFQRFYSAHTGTPYDYGGMGVGLYISKEIVTRHGGRVWFESADGRGSTFYFSLPLQVASSVRPSPKPRLG